MRLILLFAFLLSTTLTLAQQWDVVGTTQFSNNAAEARLAFSPTGEPYVVFADADFNDRTRVMRYDGTVWIDMGLVSNDAAHSQSISFNPNDNSLWVAHSREIENRVFIYRYDGSNWVSRRLSSNLRSYKRHNSHVGLHYIDDGNGPSMNVYGFPLLTANADAVRRSGNLIINNSSNGLGTTVSVGQDNAVSVDRDGNLISNGSNANAFRMEMFNYYSDFSRQTTQTVINNDRSQFYDIVDDRSIVHRRTQNTTTDYLTFFLGITPASSQPINSPNDQGELLSIDKQSDDVTYIAFAKANNEMVIERYDGNWSEMNLPSISTTTNDFFAQVRVNQSNDELYFMYKDGNSMTLLKYTPPPALPRYYVDQNATGDGSGDSWTNAMSSLSDALRFADANTTEIWVAAGTYRAAPNVNVGFEIPANLPGLKIYGGFDGTETSIEQRDLALNETIFSGDAANDDTGVGFTTASRNENAQHVFLIKSNNIEFNGITIADGHADSASSDTHRNSAGIWIDPVVNSFTLKNCTLRNNVAHTAGAGMRVWPRVDFAMDIENSIFDNNLARWAPSIYQLNEATADVTVNIANTLFSNNQARDRGNSFGLTGDIWMRALNPGVFNTTITNCTFANFNSQGTNANLDDHCTIGLSQSGGVQTANIYNTISYNNQAGSGTVKGVGNVSTIRALANSVNVFNSIAEDAFAMATSTSLTSSNDPLFTDAAAKDFTLSTGSPAIDTGDNSFVTSYPTDLLFNQRVYNGNVDMGAYEFDSVPLSLNDSQPVKAALKLYPNPADDSLNIRTTLPVERIELYNALGQRVLYSNNTNIDITSLTSGMYLVQVTLKNSQVLTSKLLKK